MTTTLVHDTGRGHRPAVSVPSARRLAALGALCAWGFAAVHGYWAAGGRLGVPAAVPTIETRPVFLAYDLAAGTVFVLAGTIGLLLAAPTGGGRHRLLLVHLALVGGAAGTVRGGLGLLQDVTTAVAGADVLPAGVIADAWFTVTGALFVVAAWRLRETARVVTRRRS